MICREIRRCEFSCRTTVEIVSVAPIHVPHPLPAITFSGPLAGVTWKLDMSLTEHTWSRKRRHECDTLRHPPIEILSYRWVCRGSGQHDPPTSFPKEPRRKNARALSAIPIPYLGPRLNSTPQ